MYLPKRADAHGDGVYDGGVAVEKGELFGGHVIAAPEREPGWHAVSSAVNALRCASITEWFLVSTTSLYTAHEARAKSALASAFDMIRTT